MSSSKVIPYNNSNGSKKEQVEQMFNNIASRYDLLNMILSLGIFKYWLNTLVKNVHAVHPEKVLDVATGTGDVAIALIKKNIPSIAGLDISEHMLQQAKVKLHRLNADEKIEWIKGDGENLPFEDNKFDAVSVAYGVRNFENLEKGLEELYRVTCNGGKLFVLEFSTLKSKIVKSIFGFYFNNICPLIGKIIAGDGSAYKYLPNSVKIFPYGEAFILKLKQAGFQSATCQPLSFGIASLYCAVK